MSRLTTKDLEPGRPVQPEKQLTPTRENLLPAPIDAKSNISTEMLIGLLVVALVLAAAGWWVAKRLRPPKWLTMPAPTTDDATFDRLCDANGLSRRERSALMRATGGLEGDLRLLLFVDPDTFSRVESAAAAMDRATIRKARAKVFAPRKKK